MTAIHPFRILQSDIQWEQAPIFSNWPSRKPEGSSCVVTVDVTEFQAKHGMMQTKYEIIGVRNLFK